MRLGKKLFIGASIVGALTFYFVTEYSLSGKVPPCLQRDNVREKIYQHLTTLKKIEHSQKVKIDDQEYTLTVNKIEPWAHVKRSLGLKIKNLENEISAVDEDRAFFYSSGGVGGIFYWEKPQFRSIDELYVNGELQETTKQREKRINKLLKPLEQDLEKLAKEEIQRKENAWKSATGI